MELSLDEHHFCNCVDSGTLNLTRRYCALLVSIRVKVNLPNSQIYAQPNWLLHNILEYSSRLVILGIILFAVYKRKYLENIVEFAWLHLGTCPAFVSAWSGVSRCSNIECGKKIGVWSFGWCLSRSQLPKKLTFLT